MNSNVIVENIEQCNKYKYNVKLQTVGLQSVGSLIGAKVNVLQLTDDTNANEILVENIVSNCLNTDAHMTVISGKLSPGQSMDPLIEMLHFNGQMAILQTDGKSPTPLNFDWVICSIDKLPIQLHEECFFGEVNIRVGRNFSVKDIPEGLKQPPYGNLWLIPKDNTKKTKRTIANLCKQYPYVRMGIDLNMFLQEI